MKKSTFLPVVLLSIIFLLSSARPGRKAEKAEQALHVKNYKTASVLYEELAMEYPDNMEYMIKLAHSLRKMNDYIGAELWYEKVVKSGNRYNDSILYYYAHSLFYNKLFNEGMEQIKKYYEKNPTDQRAKKQIDNEKFLRRIFTNPRSIFVKYLDENSREFDFAPSYGKNNTIIFSSARHDTENSRRKNTRDNTPLLQLYQAPVEFREVGEVSILSEDLKSYYHIGPACISKDGNEIYFTKNLHDDLDDKDNEFINRVGLFRALWDGEHWINIEPMRFNSDSYNVGQPAISNDGNTLYFVSDMPGGYGETDIYKSVRRNGIWSRPENMGPVINTAGREMFPTIAYNDYLYFSSDGHATMGGLDIYSSEPLANGDFDVPENLGYPINSFNDDSSLILNEDGTSGFFASNRRNGRFDNIYSFFVTELDDMDTSFVKGLDPDDPDFWIDE